MTTWTGRWHPSVGAWIDRGGATFRVWAPHADSVDLLLEWPSAVERYALQRQEGGYFSNMRPDVGPGVRYRYLIDGRGPFPDPASRFQPNGVHGPSMVVDPHRFQWNDVSWLGRQLAGSVIYELHVGTFTPEGTFAAAEARLPSLCALGVTTIELMPVADFPGARNWGYDGVALFAPARCYGSPDDLRRFVDRAHQLQLAVFLDVVYNHVGPDGAYLNAFSPYYFTDRHATPWGASVNLDGEHSAPVREFFLDNAMQWVVDYHVDGLRLDATHAMSDSRTPNFLGELAVRVREAAGRRCVSLTAEDHRNLAHMVAREAEGGWGLDGVWADDLHHQLRRILAGDSDGYYADFSGTASDIAATLRNGWFYSGQYSSYLGRLRGTDPSGVAPHQFIVCLQNHDQVGNRALGERLHHQVPMSAYRAASVLLLMAPQTPLLFMGQEWAASAPFLYFTDHTEALGRLVRDGRRAEFTRFAAFADPEARARIPDPQAVATFADSRLDWGERDTEPHASTLRLYASLLTLRAREPLLHGAGRPRLAEALDADTIAVVRQSPTRSIVVIARLRGNDPVQRHPLLPLLGGGAWRWSCLLDSESFSHDPTAPVLDLAGDAPGVSLGGPSAVVLAAEPI